MGSCNSGDYIAEDNTHTDITTCYLEKQQQKYRLGTVSNKWGGGCNMPYWIALSFCNGSKHLVCMKVS